MSGVARSREPRCASHCACIRVDAHGATGFDRKRRSRMVEQLIRGLVEADGGMQRIIRLLRQMRDIFHAVDELRVYLRTHTIACAAMA
jgi:hypothetical protein